MPKTVCLDFDGVVNTYDGWKGEKALFEPRPGLVEFLQKLIQAGWTVVINSTRLAEDIQNWLNIYNLAQYIAGVYNHKPPAIVYLDDRGITFTGDFDKAFELIQSFKVFWEK